MPKTSKKAMKRKPSDGQRFLALLGRAPTFALKEVATALYLTCKGTQAELLDALKLGDMVASVYWPDPSVAMDLPLMYWTKILPENFYVREKGVRGWDVSHYEVGRRELTRLLIIPRLKAARARLVERAKLPFTDGGSMSQSVDDFEVLSDVEQAIHAIEEGRQTAEVFVTRENARVFAREYFGSITTKGPGRPKTEADFINAALIEAFRRLYRTNPPLAQKVLVPDMQAWWNRQFDHRSEGFIRKNVDSPIRKALNLPEDPE